MKKEPRLKFLFFFTYLKSFYIVNKALTFITPLYNAYVKILQKSILIKISI